VKYKKQSKYTDEIKKYICEYVIKRTNFDYKKLIKIIENKYGVICKKSSLYNILKNQNITRKRINVKTNYNKKASNKKRKELFSEIKHIQKKNIISIDESSFDTHINSHYGWSTKGNKIEIVKQKQRIRYSVICAISIKKIIGIKIIKGSVNSVIFREFIESITNKIGKKKVLFMDNARIHHSIIFNEYIKTINNKVLYNVPYLSELNPIELCFSKVKSIVRKRNNNENKNKLFDNIKHGFNKISKNDLYGYYCKSLQI
jgi:transposase